jgi:aldose 1-epimerase
VLACTQKRARAILALLHPRDVISSGQPTNRETPRTSVVRSPFGVLADGRSVHAYTMTNSQGIEVCVLDYGGLVVSLKTPDRDGVRKEIVLGFDHLVDYEQNAPCFGALVGRYANRVANGTFTLDGATHRLAVNSGLHALHGGPMGFHRVLWHAEPTRNARSAGVVLTRTSPDGEEGYPGTLSVRVTYLLTAENELAIEYSATTDKPTPINLTHHSYFNLAGHDAGDVLRHEIAINADAFLPLHPHLIPTGVLQPVDGTPFDLRQPVTIGARINEDDDQLVIARGYDHTFVIRREAPGLVHAARVVDPATGRSVDVATTEPGIQFYTGQSLDGTIVGKGGHAYQRRSGLCLETQHFPDSPNQPAFPSTILRPGAEFSSRTVYTFGVASAQGSDPRTSPPR